MCVCVYVLTEENKDEGGDREGLSEPSAAYSATTKRDAVYVRMCECVYA